MEGVVEDAGEFVSWAVNNHFDSGWDRARKYINGKKVEDVYRPVRPPRSLPPDHHQQVITAAPPRSSQQQQQRRAATAAASSSSSSSSGGANRTGLRSASQGRNSRVRSSDFERNTAFALTRSARPLDADPYTTQLVHLPASRRKQASLLEPAAKSRFADDSDTSALIRTLNERNDRVLQEYEAETDDPARNPASVLPEKDLWTLEKHDKPNKQLVATTNAGSRRDSGMASGYNDDYRGNTQYQGETRSRSAQPPPRSRYYDDDDSDYDERSGRRYESGGRGYSDRDRYDDRDYDRYVETTERYRGPVGAGPLVVRHRRGATYELRLIRSSARRPQRQLRP